MCRWPRLLVDPRISLTVPRLNRDKRLTGILMEICSSVQIASNTFASKALATLGISATSLITSYYLYESLENKDLKRTGRITHLAWQCRSALIYIFLIN